MEQCNNSPWDSKQNVKSGGDGWMSYTVQLVDRGGGGALGICGSPFYHKLGQG